MKKFASLLLLGNLLLGTALYGEITPVTSFTKTYGTVTVTYYSDGKIDIFTNPKNPDEKPVLLFEGTMNQSTGEIVLVDWSSGSPSSESITVSSADQTASVSGGETATTTTSGGTTTSSGGTFNFTESAGTLITTQSAKQVSLSDVITGVTYKPKL